METKKAIRLKVRLGATKPEEALITAYWIDTRDQKGNKQKELCIVQHSEKIKHPDRDYKRRWKIESCFKSMKAGGLNIESSHLVNEQRFATMIKVAIMCVAWALSNGREVYAIIKSNGYRWLSVFRSGLDKIIQVLTSCEDPPNCASKNSLKPA